MNLKKIKSIKAKILIVFSTTFLLLLFLLLAVNRIFLVDYYIKSNEENLKRASKGFIRDLKNKEMIRAKTDFTKHTGANIIVYDENLKPIHFGRGMIPKPEFSRSHLRKIKSLVLASGGEGHFEISGQDDYKTKRMIYAIMMNEKDLFVSIKAMGLVEEASNMFMDFMLKTSVLIYLIGFVLIYFISEVVTRPIVKTKLITHKMAGLNFDEKLDVTSSDEIGDMMQSINLMADELSSTINALNKSNEQLEKELSKEKSLEKMRRRFVSDVSHELKNPLSMILGYADGLIQKIPKTEETKEEYYHIIVDEASRMNKLVKDLLDLSGYTSGTFTIEKLTFDVNELIDSAIERFSYVMNEKTIIIDYDKDNRYEMYADRLRMSQVIINILSNAFKHVNNEGTIRIKLTQHNQVTKIIIENTGILIPEGELNLIFNSFYQVDTESKGNGLGLAIVKSIVDLHKGSCRAYIENNFNCFEVII